MKNDLASIIQQLPAWKSALDGQRERLLSNLVMLGEIPAPTFGEERRAAFLQDRFNEVGVQDYSSDDACNVLAILPGASDPGQFILAVAHVDTVFDAAHDHTIAIQPETVEGIGLADNSLGLAALLSVPTLLDVLGLRLERSLIILGASRSLGRGNLEGIRFFLRNNDRPIKAAICLEGVRLGRLNATSMGMLRGEITCTIPEKYDWSRLGASNAILTINEVINRIMAIPLPKRPQTSIVFSSIEGGSGYSVLPSHARLRFEIRGEDADNVERVRQDLYTIAGEISARTGGQVGVDIFAQRSPGGIDFGHPLVQGSQAIMQALGIKSRMGPSTSELAALIDHGIPAVTIGLTRCENLNEEDERTSLEPLMTGLTQFFGILKAIDGGHCDGP